MSMLNDLASEEVEMEMTPMIDVTFLLLIFFMCTLKFKTLEGKLSAYLPKDVGVNSSSAEPIEKVEILVRVRQEGAKLNVEGRPYDDPTGEKRFVWNRDPKLGSARVMEYSVLNKKTNDLAELTQILTRVHDQRQATMKDGKKVPATIDPRSGSVYSDVVPVLDAAVAAGFTDITFVGAYDDSVK
ncbi:MAG: biopolymer transporter ExbD [Planctomycetes bacterium]|jgi:biopolymer transport protein ExbD|nr:biopolymer transporter ExbD [Planctomycetota bacterium]